MSGAHVVPGEPDAAGSPSPPRRVEVRVDGVVQGVGFRPFVFRLAEEYGLAGFVLNDSAGVLIEVEGPAAAVDAFVAAIPARAPVLARVEAVAVRDLAATAGRGFSIVASDDAGGPDALVSPDTAPCADCLTELRAPTDRRYRHPFVNCTNCGPRFTIVRGVPYDRPLTTMATFTMCDACRAEYDDPRDRRFHAQPNACPACGPRVSLVAADGADRAVREEVRRALAGARDVVAGAAALLAGGRIVAVKGAGGYHLACRADDDAAVGALRARKHREDRPFALMVADVDAARALVALGPAQEALLVGVARPIVLAPRATAAPISAAVAPRAPDLGVMLPSTPLHHLLLDDVGTPLVMTSGNRSDEPIAHEDDDARARLADIADAILLHDRPIHVRTDDSVLRAREGAPLMLRRARGYVPESVALPIAAARDVLAVGAELKSTFTLARGSRAWVGHHIGDLRNAETLASFTSGIAHFERLFAVRPEIVAHDLHPDLLSTTVARQREGDGLVLVGVQHHHAHLAACLAEHGETGPAVGAIYDGTGFGPDGTAWGGEILVGDLRSFTRVGSLRPVALPGGDRAAREPWRMACAWLIAGLAPGAEVGIPRALRDAVEPTQWENVARLARSGFAAPPTTSMGRLFDAVAALCGVRAVATYEGQAAAELEGIAAAGDHGAYSLPRARDGALDACATIADVLADLRARVDPAVVSARFHAGVARGTAVACAAAASAAGLDRVVLSGGVFQNRLLADLTARELRATGLRPLLPERLPPNDGGVSFGQAAVAAARTAT